MVWKMHSFVVCALVWFKSLLVKWIWIFRKNAISMFHNSFSDENYNAVESRLGNRSEYWSYGSYENAAQFFRTFLIRWFQTDMNLVWSACNFWLPCLLWFFPKLLENSKLALVSCSYELRGWVSPNSESCTSTSPFFH